MAGGEPGEAAPALTTAAATIRSLSPDVVERLARAAHDVTCTGLVRRGFRPGSVSDDAAATATALRAYDALTEEERDQNRAFVRDILAKLAAVGCHLARGPVTNPPVTFSETELERLAILEHDRYVAAKLSSGWRPGAVTDRSRRTHRWLVPWSQLSDEQKQRDRELVAAIPVLVARAGYTIERTGQDPP